MKKCYSHALAGLLFAGLTACNGGKQQTETDTAADSTTVEVQATETAQATDAAPAAEAKAQAAETPKLNAALFGSWSNFDDPGITMKLAEKKGNHDGYNGYGYLTASNEYYEIDFTLIFTSLTPDGDNIKVHYEQMDSYIDGDPDDPDSPCEMVMNKVGEGDLTLIAQGSRVKIDCKEQRIKNKVLSRQR